MLKLVTAEELTAAADRIVAIREIVKSLDTEEKALRERVLAAHKSGITVTTSDGLVAKVSTSKRISYRVKEVLALIRREKLDAGKYLTVKAAEIGKLPEELTEKLPRTVSESPVLKFAVPEAEVTLTLE